MTDVISVPSTRREAPNSPASPIGSAACDVVAGPISFSSLKHAAARSSLGTRRPDGTWFRKSAAKVLWRRAATLSVPAEHR